MRRAAQAWLPELGMYHYKARIYSPTLGRFLQTDPIGYDDQINLYAYVGNDPVNNKDPDGKKCVGVVGLKTCNFDTVALKGGPKLTLSQVANAKDFEARYTKVVNRLETSNRSTIVAVKGHPSFKITAKEVGASLASRNLYYSPRGSSGNALAVTSGNLVRPSTTVFESGLKEGNRTDNLIAHEGIHNTFAEDRAIPGYALGVEPGRTGHQDPYNSAADKLLGPNQ